MSRSYPLSLLVSRVGWVMTRLYGSDVSSCPGDER
jgi:hypothetical protein